MRPAASFRPLIAAVLLLAGANVWVWGLLWSGPGRLVITFLDVGQGDSIVIQSPSGRVLVVDAGPRSETNDAGRQIVVPYLRSRGIERIDGLVLTHPHGDHIGGAGTLLDRASVRQVLVGETKSEEAEFERVLRAARDRGVPVSTLRRGMRLELGAGVTADVLNPSDSDAISPNDGSVGLRIRYGSTACVLAGDAEAAAEAEMAASGDLRADVLKLSHHGSRTSSTPSFLAAVRPQAAVVSVGAHNAFGHPSGEVLDRIKQADIGLFRTDRDGAVIIESDGRSMAIRATKKGI